MKLVAVIVALIVLVAVHAQYKSIKQSTCQNAQCSSGCQVETVPANKCLRTTSPGLYVVGNCSANGATFFEYVFTDAQCTKLMNKNPIPTATCEQIRGGGYAEWTCSKTVDEELPLQIVV